MVGLLVWQALPLPLTLPWHSGLGMREGMAVRVALREGEGGGSRCGAQKK